MSDRIQTNHQRKTSRLVIARRDRRRLLVWRRRPALPAVQRQRPRNNETRHSLDNDQRLLSQVHDGGQPPHNGHVRGCEGRDVGA